MSGNKKNDEGIELIKQAEKHLKTGLLKWRPDYELAADCYNKAFTCFKNARAYAQAKDCLFKAADCYKETRSFFSAAKCLDQAILVKKEMNDLESVEQTAHRACQLYQENGSPDTAALSLDKAAKIVETQLPEKALTLYRRAMEVVMLEDRPRQAAEYAAKLSRLLLRLKKYDEAADILLREIGYHQDGGNSPALGRTVIGLMLVQLAREDVIAAGKVLQEWGGCVQQEELSVAVQLHQAFDSEDPEQAKQAVNHPFIKHMDVEFAKLARDIPLPEGLEGLAKASVKKTEREPVEDLEDEFEEEFKLDEKKPSVRETYDDEETERDDVEEAERDEDVKEEAKESKDEEDDDDFSGGLC